MPTTMAASVSPLVTELAGTGSGEEPASSADVRTSGAGEAPASESGGVMSGAGRGNDHAHGVWADTLARRPGPVAVAAPDLVGGAWPAVTRKGRPSSLG